MALLGAIGVIGLGAMTKEQASRAVDLPTVLLLFSFMVVSAQMRLGGFYTAVTRRVAALLLGRSALLGAIIAVAGTLSAVFSNDIICLAMTPVVAQLCLKRRLDPVPFLLGLGCAANIGSLPAAARPDPQPGYGALQTPPVDAWQTLKGLLVAMALLLVFLFTDWPREVAALVGAGVLLLSRRLHSSHVMGFIDWQLLVLFMGLFVVNHAFQSTGLAAQAVALLAAQGEHLTDPGPLFVAGVGLSNLVSNMPAVMLLPHLKDMDSGVTLALVITFSGNLLLVGSIANLIVVDLAQKSGVTINWRMHARVGVPVTLLTLAVVWASLRWL